MRVFFNHSDHCKQLGAQRRFSSQPPREKMSRAGWISAADRLEYSAVTSVGPVSPRDPVQSAPDTQRRQTVVTAAAQHSSTVRNIKKKLQKQSRPSPPRVLRFQQLMNMNDLQPLRGQPPPHTHHCGVHGLLQGAAPPHLPCWEVLDERPHGTFVESSWRS